ncbi:MAG: hypothetical protein ABIQ32_13120 [Sphingomicrobium sp.]
MAIEVEKITEHSYKLASPHSDTEAWQAMVCDALGTRSEATALTFLNHLTPLCQKDWHPDDENGGGEWVPNECELNMILNMVAGIKPKNEMQAALAAQMVAVHLLMMKVSERCLRTFQCADPGLVAVAAKLARTFAVQTEALAKLQGRRTSRQKITVSYEKHDHKHVHMTPGVGETGRQPHAAMEDRTVSNGVSPALLSQDAEAELVPVPGRERETGVPDARRKESRSATRRS